MKLTLSVLLFETHNRDPTSFGTGIFKQISMAYDKDPVFVLAAGAAFPAVSIVVVALRFYVRSTQKARYGPDDWLALAGLVGLPLSFAEKLQLKFSSGVLNRSRYSLDYRYAPTIVSTFDIADRGFRC